MSMKSDRSQSGICLLQNFNQDDETNPYARVQIGDELDVKLAGKTDEGLFELV